MKTRTGNQRGWAPRTKVERARALRRQMTPTERTLWEALRGDALGFSVRRQHLVLGWIADFYVPAAKLVIEVDGGVHDTQPHADAERTRALEEAGLCVLRVRNEDVLQDLPAVCMRIARVVLG